MSSQREPIATLEHPGRPVLACSASGRSISAVWPALRAYAVYTLAPTGSWECVDRGVRWVGWRQAAGQARRRETTQQRTARRLHGPQAGIALPPPPPPTTRLVPYLTPACAGSGNNVVWSNVQPMYAVISVPNIPTAAPKKKKVCVKQQGGSCTWGQAGGQEPTSSARAVLCAGSSVRSGPTACCCPPCSCSPQGLFGGSKKAAAEAAEVELAAEAARAAARGTTVEVHVVNEEAGSQFVATHGLQLGGEQPVLLHGGGLLGVVLNKPAPSGQGERGRAVHGAPAGVRAGPAAACAAGQRRPAWRCAPCCPLPLQAG